MSPEVRIRLLAQEANFHCTGDESLYVECLRPHGIGEELALETYRFVQIALGRRLSAMKKIQPSDMFCRFDKEGREIEEGDLSNHPAFAAATALAHGLFTLRAAKVIAYSSPEVRATIAQMAHGIRPDRVRLRPCILFTQTPNPAIVRRVKQYLDERFGLERSARLVRPWWKRLRGSQLTLKTYTRKLFR